MSIKSTATFDFLLKIFRNLPNLLRSLTYLSLLNSFLFLSRFSVSLKSLDNYFFRWFAYKSLLSRFSVLISCNMCSSNNFSISSRFQCFQGLGFSGSRFFKDQVFQGPGFSGSRFFRVQVFRVRVQDPDPGSRVRVQVIEVALKQISYETSYHSPYTIIMNKYKRIK